MKSKILVRIVLMLSLVLSAKAETTENQNSSSVIQDFKTAYYWSFYGQYSKDPQTLGDVMSRLSDLTSKIYSVSSAEAYDVFKTDVLAQGGPQLLLASVGAERVLVGLKLGLVNEVSAFVNATHKLNPQLGASYAIMSLGYAGTKFDPSVRTSANPMKPGDVDRCMQSCAIYFLGLQNNRFAVDLFAGRARNKNEYSEQDRQQIAYKFPNNQKDNRGEFRGGVNSKVAAISNRCVSLCVNEIGAAAGAVLLPAISAILANPLVGSVVTAGVVIAGTSGVVLHCSTSPDCTKTRKQELQEQESSRLKAENDVREERLRSKELDRKEAAEKDRRDQEAKKEQEKKAKAEAAKRQEEQKQEEKHKETEKKIKDSYDPSKNKEAKTDSSTSCESTNTCDGTMNALTMPDKYRESSESSSKTDGRGNIITSRDMTSTPQTREMNEDKGFIDKTDAAGNPVTEKDMTSMPMKKLDVDSGDSNRDHNGKTVTKRDMTSTPLVNNDGITGPLNPNKGRGVSVITTSKVK
ncbi:hypothetical protein [Bdellovibrio sp. BCCA]|uniref:hypothetical protein n=1 Tax=Bdellovibrio sp. BCCA TaxID=3136281 RepID=UPI0030F08DFA